MKSAVFLGTVSHVRKAVKPYRFSDRLPWWLLDLSELPALDRLRGFGHNRFSAFTFRDHDHISLGHASASENIRAWVRAQGVSEELTSIQLLTNLRTWGYVFNPVSFYFLQGTAQRWIVAEVGNTFWEQKPTLLGPFTGDAFECEIPKLFYVSPFLSLENRLHLTLTWPSDTLAITIRDFSPAGSLELTAHFQGERRPLTQRGILALALSFPFLCTKIIAAIHWHALKLWLMGIPYFRKTDRLDLQQGVFQWKSRKFVRPSPAQSSPAAPSTRS